MKNLDSNKSQDMSWNEFRVVARNYPHAMKFKNHTLNNSELDLRVHVRNDTRVYPLDTEQVLDYTYREDDMQYMDQFRVSRYNERFQFTVENPSDKAFQEQAIH